MREIIESIILAIVEGLTEFLPVSSTGHMIIVQDLLDIPKNSFNNMYMIVVQLAAILAVLILYWPRIWKVIKGIFTGKRKAWHFLGVWIVACIPAAALGVLIDDVIDEYLFSTPTVTIALIIGAIMMLSGEKRVALYNTDDEVLNINYKQAIIIGIAQCMALFPGFSRSASTIIGGWAAGLTTAAAADFSFFLAIPIMFGASIYSLLKFSQDTAAVAGLVQTDYIALIIGCIVAFVVAWFVVKKFLNYLKTKPLKNFAYYRIILAIILIVLMSLNVIK